MNWISIVILIIVVAIFALAIVLLLKGKTGCCSGDCVNCSKVKNQQAKSCECYKKSCSCEEKTCKCVKNYKKSEKK